MKLIINTGGEAHTSSSASLQVYFSGGSYDGQPLYQQKQFKKKEQWDNSRMNASWVTTEYDLPEGTQIRIDGKGKSGNGGVNRHRIHRIYRLDSQTELLEEHIPLGPYVPLLKGNLTLVRDLVEEERQKKAISLEEGFETHE